MNHEHSQHDGEPKSFWNSRYSIGLIVMGVIAAYFLVTEHRAHFFGALPWLLLLAWPLMHVFMHSGHGERDNSDSKGHGGQHRLEGSAAPQPPKTGDQS